MLRRAWAGALFAVVLVFVAAGPASAHGGPVGDEPPATNWRSRITTFDSPDPGITIAMIDAGEKVQLTNQSDQTVTVIGYENEPYLRVGPDGVFENRRSPAAYLNISIAGGATVPTTADAKAEPEWQRVTTSNRVSWHDHRSHWMGGDPPPAVQSDAGTERVVIERWVIPIEVGDQRSDVIGDLTWVPAPPSWPWFLAIAVLSAGIGAAAFTPRWKPVIWVGALTLLASCGIDIVGTWWGSTDPMLQKAAALITPSLAFAFLIVGLLFLDKRRDDGLLLTFGGSAGVAVFFGWTSRGFLTNSQIPIALTPSLARLTVTLALGVGLGMMLLVLGLNRASLAALLPGWSTQDRGAARKGIPTRPAPTRVRRRRIVFGVSAAVGIVAVAVIASVATRPSGDATSLAVPVSTSGHGDLSEGLCTAIAAAARGDTNAARQAFEDIHTQLHVVAEAETVRDRGQAARLLEAKQRVESDLSATPGSLEPDLRALHTITSTIRPTVSPGGRC